MEKVILSGYIAKRSNISTKELGHMNREVVMEMEAAMATGAVSLVEEVILVLAAVVTTGAVAD